MSWTVVTILVVFVILILILNSWSSRRAGRHSPGRTATAVPPRRLSNEKEIRQSLGSGELANTELGSTEVATTQPHSSHTPKDTKDGHERIEPRRASGQTDGRRGSGERTRTYARHDWQKRFEESIQTPFPEEWSPALPYLYEAHKLEKEGADQREVQEILEKARESDSSATSFYLARWSIIKKRRNQSQEHRPEG